MEVIELGHVNLWVTNLDRSSAFYRDVLGLSQVAGGVLKRDESPSSRSGRGTTTSRWWKRANPRRADHPIRRGLNHIGFKVGNHVDDLRRMRDWLIDHDTAPHGYVDHHVCLSLHVVDPDGNDIELYVDGDPEVWERTPEAMVCSNPFLLE